MRRNFVFFSFYIFCTFLAHSQVPPEYYEEANNKQGSELKAALHKIINGHREYPYTSSGTDVWDILKETDEDPANPNNVIGIYSAFSMDAEAEYNNGSGWNREHVWAKSRGDFGTSPGPGTDVHHIRAADISTNSARNNRNFDESTEPYVDNSGVYKGSTKSFTSSSLWIWEPREEVKGDVARMLFYMAVRYEGTGGEPDLELREEYLSNNSKEPFHSKLSILVQWHLNDPVDDYERRRNDIIYNYQQNRNPFIDHPEFVCEIWKSSCSVTALDEYDDIEKEILVYPNPVAGDFINIGFEVNQEAEVRILTLQGNIKSSNFYYEGDEIVLPTASLAKGVYIIQILDSGKNYYIKFQKQ